MPKMKTKKALAKRVKRTGSGKLKLSLIHIYFYMSALLQDRFKNTAGLNENQLAQYLQGLPLTAAAPRGFLCLRYEGYPVGLSLIHI